MPREKKDSKRPKGYYSIEEATLLLGFKYSIYTRRLVLEGKLASKKVAYKGYSKVYIPKTSIDLYLKNSRRSIEGRRYNLYLDPKLEGKVRELLEANNIEYRLVLAYKGKE